MDQHNSRQETANTQSKTMCNGNENEPFTILTYLSKELHFSFNTIHF